MHSQVIKSAFFYYKVLGGQVEKVSQAAHRFTEN